MTDRQPSPRKHLELLPRQVREALVAVVVDANTYGKDGPDLTGMHDLARDLKPLGIELWVPEPVAWEMAEHAARAWATAKNEVKTARSALKKAGLKPAFDPVYASRAEIIDDCLARFEASGGITVVPLTGPSAIEGLKDQIQQRPPGKTKGEAVKTGASDSAWLRDVLARVNGQTQRLLFLSEDNDIAAAFKHWGLQPPLTCARGEIRSLLIPTEPATNEETVLIARHLLARMPEDLLNPPTETGTALVEADSNWLRRTLELGGNHPGGDGLTEVYLTRLTAVAGLVRAAHLRPEPQAQTGPAQHGAHHQTVTASAYFLAEAELARTAYDEAADEPATSLRSVSGEVYAWAPLVFEISDGTVLAVRQDGAAHASVTSTVTDPDVAFAILREALSTVPGLAPVDKIDWKAKGESEVEFTAPAGPTVGVARFEDDHGDYGFKVRVGDQHATAVCARGAQPWRVGTREEPGDVYLYKVVFEGPDGRSRGGAWALSAWIIAATLGRG